MDVAILEEGNAGTEDEISGTLNVAVLEVIALDAAELAKPAIGVQGVLVAQEAAAVEEEEVAVGEHRHRLADFLALAGAVLEAQVFEGDVAGVDIDGGAAGSAHGDVPVGPEGLGVFVKRDERVIGALTFNI